MRHMGIQLFSGALGCMALLACTGANQSLEGDASRAITDGAQADRAVDTFVAPDTLKGSDARLAPDVRPAPEGGPDASMRDTRIDLASPTGPRNTFYVSGKDIYDSCGGKFIARGINHPTLYVDRAGDAVPEIAMTGSNIVRLFWYAGHGVPITEAEPIIAKVEQAGMVPMLELHDSTCAWSLDKIKSYWTSAEAVALITKYQRSFWLNIANEASQPSAAAFVSKYTEIILAIRATGIKVPLVIDGGRCGRDSDVLLENGTALQNADPEHNVIFSWHFYDPLSKGEITQVLAQSMAKNLPFIVGEFAHKSPPGCGAALDYKFLLAESQRLGIGWLAWSWGDDDAGTWWNSDCAEFDMTRTLKFSTLERWGLEVAVSDPNSIKNTASRARGLTGSCQ